MLRQPLHGVMEPHHPLALDQPALGVFGTGHQAGFQGRIESLFGSLPRANFETVVVGHAKNPPPGVFDVLALLEGGVQAQKHFLHSLLRLGRVQPQRQEVAVDVLARFYKQLSHLILQRAAGALLPEDSHDVFTSRRHRHRSKPYQRPASRRIQLQGAGDFFYKMGDDWQATENDGLPHGPTGEPGSPTCQLQGGAGFFEHFSRLLNISSTLV
ncbi:hypothetical protein SBA4_1840038 [Candidatus Sulfopaludibacter sp. SbA4]|nr:hypothetical protein SBA4_1840038 [Candidatus Sulfopaludibacter sp. SbA4]